MIERFCRVDEPLSTLGTALYSLFTSRFLIEVSQYSFHSQLLAHPSQNRAGTINAHGSSYHLNTKAKVRRIVINMDIDFRVG